MCVDDPKIHIWGRSVEVKEMAEKLFCKLKHAFVKVQVELSHTNGCKRLNGSFRWIPDEGVTTIKVSTRERVA